jgi:Fe-S cluster assembly protein SufB
MTAQDQHLENVLARGYQHGFVTDIESDTVPPGLDEETIRFISARKKEPQFLLDWRLRALPRWLTMKEPHWAHGALPADRLPGHLVLLRAQGDQ